MQRSRRVVPSLIVVVLLCATGCSSDSSPASTATTAGRRQTSPTDAPTVRGSVGNRLPSGAEDWPTYHRSNDRLGVVSPFKAPQRLARAWDVALDGAVYGQPIVVHNTVIAATENNTVYSLDLATGGRNWTRHLATPVPQTDLPCGNIDPLGITGTPAYDASTRSVFVATESTGGRHDLVALYASDGRVRFTRGLDVTRHDRLAEQQRSALAVANGRVYVAFGGLYGDCGNYVGYVAAVKVTGRGPVASYKVPTPRQGGIWAASGPATDPTGGDVYVAVGNGARTGGSYDGSDSVLRLAPDLSARRDFFAPRNWGSENAADADLGSTGPLLLPGGRALIAGKTGDVYLLDVNHMGGIGGQLSRVSKCAGFGGMAYDAGAAFVPCTSGLLRVNVNGRTLSRGWQADSSISGSPVVGGGAVWALDTGAGTLHALRESDGHPIAQVAVGPVSRFASPVLSRSRVLVGTTRGVVALSVT